MSISRAIQNFPNVSVSFCPILIDTNHNLNNREDQRYTAIKDDKDCIEPTNTKYILLTAKLYDQSYLDL